MAWVAVNPTTIRSRPRNLLLLLTAECIVEKYEIQIYSGQIGWSVSLWDVIPGEQTGFIQLLSD